jgi:chromosome segregation ATPase
VSILGNRHRPDGEDKVAIDPEQQLYKDMAELKSGIRSLKTRLTKLSGRIESLELMAFQDQISNLNDKVEVVKRELKELAEQQLELARTLRNVLTTTQLYSAALKIESLLSALRRIIENQLPNKAPTLLTQLYADASNAKSQLQSSDTPLDIALQFKKSWQNRLQELGLKLGSDFIEY